jgi:hypothetical protein
LQETALAAGGNIKPTILRKSGKATLLLRERDGGAVAIKPRLELRESRIVTDIKL